MPGPEPIIRAVAEIEPLADEWDALADSLGAPLFLRPGWVAAWRRAFGEGSLTVLTAWAGDRLLGVAPLQRAGGKLAATANFHTPVYGLLGDGDGAAALARALFRHAARRVSLSFLDRARADERLVRAAASEAGFRVVERSVSRSPYVDTSDEWEAYEAALSKNLRSDVRRRRRRLEEAGGGEVEVQSGDERLDDLLEEAFAVEGSGWKSAEGTAIASRPETRRFYTEIAHWAARRGALRLSFLRVDGRAIACHFNLADDGVEYHLKGGYDPDEAAFSPAKVLHYALVERAFASTTTRYEFLGADEPYKLQFANGQRELVRLEAFAPSVAGIAERAFFAYGRPVAKRVLARVGR